LARYRKILVAFDGSPSAANALEQALALPELAHGTMKVLAIVPPYEGDLELVGVRDPEAVMQGQIDALRRAASAALGPAADRVAVVIEEGKAYQKIVEVAGDESCDLVVMGRRGLRRLERMLMGSVTARVIAHSTKDVLVVPRDAAVALDDVVVATDGSAHGEAALETAMYFARSHGGAITAVAVAEMYPESYADAPRVVEMREQQAAAILGRVAETAESAGYRVNTRLLRGDPAGEIVSYAKASGAGMIFVGSRGRSGLEKLLLGSVAEKIIGLSHCPVYVAKLRRQTHLRPVNRAGPD
jgi:nucleotide-binding universal stress UspA family protein